jgi:hypothetical protein
MTLQEAIDYLNFCEKNGGYEVDCDGMSDKQIIKLAQQMSDAAEGAWESYQDSHHEGHEIGGCFVCKDGL